MADDDTPSCNRCGGRGAAGRSSNFGRNFNSGIQGQNIMIAFSNTASMAGRGRGRPAGVRNELACAPKGIAVSGSSTSAAKMNCRSGTAGRNPAAWLWIPGEGWVRWMDLALQVAEAYDQWRKKKAMQGIRVMDGWEWRQAQIDEAMGARNERFQAGGRYLRTLQGMERDREADNLVVSIDAARDLGVRIDGAEAA